LKKFDVTDNGYYDLSVSLDSISSNRAKITIKSLSEEIPTVADVTPVISGDVVDDESIPEGSEGDMAGEAKPDLMWLWIVIIIILVLSYVGYKKFKKKK